MWAGPAAVRGGGATHPVYVVRRGYHTDIGLRVADLDGVLARVAARFPGAQALLVGFGDRTFVTTREKWIGTWVLSLLPGRGAMLVTGLRVTPDAVFPARQVVTLLVDQARLQAIAAYVGASFEADAGMPRFIGNGPYAGSAFFASSRTYDLLDTCNTWTDAALARGGEPVRPAMTFFAGQTMAQARRAAASAR